MDQHALGRVGAEAARTEIENAFVVQLADGRAVRAFHVIGINLELRLGVGGRVVGQQQIFVGLLGVGFLGDFAHQNAAVENPLGLVIKDAVEIFVAGAMRFRVFHDHVMIGELFAAREVQPVQHALEAFAGEFYADVIARKPGAERKGMHAGVAGATEFTGNGRHVKRVQRLILQFDVLDHRVITGHNFRDRVGEVRHVGRTQIAFHHRQLGVRLGNDQIARQNYLAVFAGGGNINQFHRFGDFLALRHKDKRAVREERLVESGKGVAGRLGILAQMLFNQRGIRGNGRGQIFNPHAAGHRLDAGELRAKITVHKHQAMARQLGKNGFFQGLGFRAVHGHGSGHLEGELGNGRHVRIAPVLVAQGGKAELGKPGDARLADGQEPLRLGGGFHRAELFNNRFDCVTGIFWRHNLHLRNQLS